MAILKRPTQELARAGLAHLEVWHSGATYFLRDKTLAGQRAEVFHSAQECLGAALAGRLPVAAAAERERARETEREPVADATTTKKKPPKRRSIVKEALAALDERAQAGRAIGKQTLATRAQAAATRAADLEAAVRAQLERELRAEGIIESVAAVNLSTAYAPVCPERHSSAVFDNVRPTLGGAIYWLVKPNYRGTRLHMQRVTTEELRIMRARFLYRQGLYRYALSHQLLPGVISLRNWVLTNYFGGLDLSQVTDGQLVPPLSKERTAAYHALPSPLGSEL